MRHAAARSPTLQVNNFKGPVDSTGNHLVPERMGGYGRNLTAVSLQISSVGPVLEIPKDHHPIPVTGNSIASIGRYGERLDGTVVAAE
jgi:hypothetical protein